MADPTIRASLTDVELAEHIELVKEVREKAHPPPGETFDRIKYRLLINALPSCVLIDGHLKRVEAGTVGHSSPAALLERQ